MRRRTFIALAAGVSIPWLCALSLERVRPSITPQIPTADREAPNRVFLEHADRLYQERTDSFMIVAGDVVFSKGGMIMRCDSAHYTPESESMDAFGHVSMTSGDTLRITADEMNYNGTTELAVLYAPPGGKVVMVNRDVTLETDVFYYDMGIELAYYRTGGRMFDPSNTLTSVEAEYTPQTREALFYTDVHLNSRDNADTLDIYSDTLYYNTVTKVAELYSPSTIINRRGTIYTRMGIYDTEKEIATLFDRSTVVSEDGKVLTADTIYYDKPAGYQEAFGSIELVDTVRHAAVYGNYGYYDSEADSSFVTGHAMMMEFSGPDTLYLHGRYIQTFRRIDSIEVEEDTLAGIPRHILQDTVRMASVFPRVRFYRKDLQGLCDTMLFVSKDSTLTMYHNPVVWSEDRQIFGGVITLTLNDSTIERAVLPNNGFMAQFIEGDHYNQMSGKKMRATFEDGDLRTLDIDGNVELILYPEENDSTINKMVKAESSFLAAVFYKRNTESVRMWPQTTGQAIPLFLARPGDYYLPKFKWFGLLRPTDKADIFNVTPEMDQLMGNSPAEIPYSPRSPIAQPVFDTE